MSRRDLTAIARTEASRPLRLLLEQGIISKGTSVLDLGSGRGADIEYLKSLRIRSKGWDPVFSPATRKSISQIVTLTYVLNVIENPAERITTLKEAWALCSSVLAVSVRLEDERDEAHIKPVGDGWMTSRGTFQHFYNHSEFGEWIEGHLGVTPIAAAPGTFLVFRKAGQREQYLARKYSVRIPVPHFRKSDKMFLENRDALEPLITFFIRHGRLPKSSELNNVEMITEIFGSIGRAFRVIEVVTDHNEWSGIAERRRIDIYVFLALRLLDGEYRMSDLDESMRADVRAHHGSFAAAFESSVKLLFNAGKSDSINLACRSSVIGKLTPSALYVHADALQHLPALLKIYEGCAKRIIGHIPEANIIKLHRDSKKVSYLSYPDFDTDPHPAIAESFIVDLTDRKYKRMKWTSSQNKPVLHRKETFIHKTDDRYDRFAELTQAEEMAGLLEDSAGIGYHDQWNDRLKNVGYEIKDHTLRQIELLEK